jgi:hypothetical protein
MNKGIITKIGLPVAAVIASIGIGFAGVTSAQVATDTQPAKTEAGKHVRGMMGRMGMNKEGGRGVGGTVTAVSGTTVTITGKDGKTYTVNGANAKVTKISTITVGDIKVGDTIGAHGTVSGTTITAEHIMDGIPAEGMMHGPEAK